MSEHKLPKWLGIKIGVSIFILETLLVIVVGEMGLYVKIITGFEFKVFVKSIMELTRILGSIRLVFYLITYMILHFELSKDSESSIHNRSTKHCVAFIILSIIVTMICGKAGAEFISMTFGWYAVLAMIPISYLSAYLTYKAFHRIYKLPLE